MGSLSCTKLVCRLRGKAVAATPEEKVRQALVDVLIDKLGYSASLISVEKELKEFDRHAPHRRADIVVFGPRFVPWLLIECKAVALSDRCFEQAIGYNSFVRAPYLVLANQDEVQTGTLQEGEYRFLAGLPSYKSVQEQMVALNSRAKI